MDTPKFRKQTLLFFVFLVGTVITLTSTTIYFFHNDSKEYMRNLNANLPVKISEFNLTTTAELTALIATSTPMARNDSMAKNIIENVPTVIPTPTNTPSPQLTTQNAKSSTQNAISEQRVNTSLNEHFSSLMKFYSNNNALIALSPKNWNNWNWPSKSIQNQEPPKNIEPISDQTVLWPRIQGKATYIEIPIIDVKSEVKDLKIIESNGIKKYESPDNFVGRIPSDGSKHDSISAWYFGHLESPIKGEGNIFHRLPSLPNLIRDGEKVYIILENYKSKYVYQAVSSKVVPAEKLRLHNEGNSSIFLVTCVNRPTYDQRLIVKANIVGIIE